MNTEQKSEHFGKRFRSWRESQGISAYRIAKLTGIHPSFISNIEANRRPMSEAFMKKIAAIAEFNITYEMLRAWKIQSQYAPQELQEAFKNTLNENGQVGAGPITTDDLYQIPLLLELNNTGIQPKGTPEKPAYINWSGLVNGSDDLVCLQVKGDSACPPLPDGAILVVREVKDMQNGSRYLVETNEELSPLKLVQFDASGNKLVPLMSASSSTSLTDTAIKRLYQVLSFKVDWA